VIGDPRTGDPGEPAYAIILQNSVAAAALVQHDAFEYGIAPNTYFPVFDVHALSFICFQLLPDYRQPDRKMVAGNFRRLLNQA